MRKTTHSHIDYCDPMAGYSMIHFNDFKGHLLTIRESVDDAVRKVLESGRYILGEQLEAFEKEFADYLGVNYCVGVASGTDAITLSLKAMDIGRGDEVITTNVTAFPTITGILRAQAVPVVVDINADDGLMDIAAIESKITPRTKAIAAVHLYGQCCDMDALGALAKNRGLRLIEDAAQAAGACYKGKKAGSLGDCNAFSFYPTKNLGAFGDGGAIATDSRALYRKLVMARNYGQSNRNFHEVWGINSRLDELQAAVLRVKLKHLELWNDRRRMLAHYYRMHLQNVVCLKEHAYARHNYHLFVVRHENRDACLLHLKKNGIEAMVHYPIPVNRQKTFPTQKNEPFPESEKFTKTILSLPLYPELPDEHIEQIVAAINKFGAL
jgi:dTDP-4-amino-4,6-dideoxygalactose transaminase